MHKGWAIAAASLVGVGAAVIWVRRQLTVVTVQGGSMAPTLSPGDRLVVSRRRLAQLRQGDIVVLRPPLEQFVDPTGATTYWNIKRVVALPGEPVPAGAVPTADFSAVPEGKLVVHGDHRSSLDSRQLGFFDTDQLLGVAVRRLGGDAL